MSGDEQGDRVGEGSGDAGPSREARATAEAAIERLRDNIDSVDAVLVKLFNQRARWALEIGDVKKTVDMPVYQPDREAKVLARVMERNRGPLPPEAIRRLFERIIDENRRLERLGTEGSGPEGSGIGEGAEGGTSDGTEETEP